MTSEQNNVTAALHILLSVLKKPSISATSFKISMDEIRTLIARFAFVPISDKCDATLSVSHEQECDYFWKMKIYRNNPQHKKLNRGHYQGLVDSDIVLHSKLSVYSYFLVQLSPRPGECLRTVSVNHRCQW